MATNFKWRLLACLSVLVIAVNVYANQPFPVVSGSALEKRVTHLAEELRCLVCQNQTIADSQADLAVDLKNQIREKLAQGFSEDKARDFIVQRYGDFVLYRPPLKATTWMLWFGPFLMLLVGLGVLTAMLRQQGRTTRVPDEGQPKELK